ncbi:amylo-alpha-1,6-glucosidase [Allorhizocola rhizosphaerae]|uniref:amylo-alpha-1,6-glucosidase n=1 Tax=Allorhizocola rhizosphaerae TaxID=1872709 RepID=UPI000E3DA238|nr:trehalase family glycosidase [Allorhizocola rhizosphaerae]
MTRPVARDWNTWDTQYHTAAAHLPSGVRVRVGVGTPDGRIIDDFTWRRGLERLGHHTVDGEYAEVTVRVEEALVRLVFTNPYPDVLCGLVEISEPGYTAHLIEDRLPGAGPDSGEYRWSVSQSSPAPGVLRFAWAPEPFDPNGFDFEAARERAESAAIGSSGWLGRSAEGYQRALTWNTVIRTDLGRVITPTSRDFVHAARGGFYGTWALHGWDTFFCGLTATWIDHDYARGIYDQMLEQLTPGGFVPNRVSDERGRTDDRSQPPVGAYTMFKSYLSTGLSDETRDVSLLSQAYEPLLRWHDWWPRARRGRHGMLAWGSDPTGDPKSATVDSTRRESGLDDSPMYDDIQYDPVTHTMDLADVGLNALHAADSEALAHIADRLGDKETAARLRAGLAEARRRVEDVFWDEASGHYRNRKGDGSFDIHLAPTSLYPLLAGISSPERARRNVETLLVPELLGGSPPLPSVSRSDPGYNRHYMRGRIWGPISFLVVEGLRRYGMRDHVTRIVDEHLAMFRQEWEEHSHVHENYFSSPDEDIHPFEARSDFLLSWGNLLAYLAMQEMADARVSGWRFAHPGQDASLTNLVLREGKLSVSAGERLRVTLDGALLIDAPQTTVVADYERSSEIVRAVVGGPGSISLGVPTGAGDTVKVRIGDAAPAVVPVRHGGVIVIELPGADRVQTEIFKDV